MKLSPLSLSRFRTLDDMAHCIAWLIFKHLSRTEHFRKRWEALESTVPIPLTTTLASGMD